MPDYLQTAAKLLPLAYLNYGLRDAMILRDTAIALHNMSIVLIAGALFFVISSLKPIGARGVEQRSYDKYRKETNGRNWQIGT